MQSVLDFARRSLYKQFSGALKELKESDFEGAVGYK